MIFALVLASLGGILFAALLANVVFLLLLRVALRDSDSILQACGPSLRSLLHDTTWLSCFATSSALWAVSWRWSYQWDLRWAGLVHWPLIWERLSLQQFLALTSCPV
ncbi:hypothetical protein SEVIR_6G154950v4 [Setaria viridis]|uniref:Uncharacterized protein n=1 Tax=Setaria viridis TaxID=4556 RepID=A0A4U6UA21_SETVI|nr:hypothetical protein SEVIR_6G154950v2 [Setaria viridis]